jgi:hypothetical protein
MYEVNRQVEIKPQPRAIQFTEIVKAQSLNPSCTKPWLELIYINQRPMAEIGGSPPKAEHPSLTGR